MSEKSISEQLDWYTTPVNSRQLVSHSFSACLSEKLECQFTSCLVDHHKMRDCIHSEYAIQLRHKLESSYDAIWHHRQQVLHHQKDNYDKKVPGNSYTEGALVWLHNPVVPFGQSRKFHQPWTGPFRLIRLNKPTESRALQIVDDDQDTVPVARTQVPSCQ